MIATDDLTALKGVRVLDTATLFAGPLAATMMADFGADVIKIEHPRGDPARNHGPKKDGLGLWWKTLSRNKRAMTLNLSTQQGQSIMRRLVADADVWVENFRPGTLERWGLGYDELSAINPRLILVRVTGFGQFGPYASRPGFGTLAEAMSGFANLTGQVGGPPTLPPFGLGDGVAGISAAFATMLALRAREANGRGQVVDISLIEPLMSILGPHAIAYDQLGVKQARTGNRSAKNAPRNTYLTKDGKWVAVSTSSDSIAERVMHLVGHPEVVDEPWFGSASGRVQHVDELDRYVADWIAARNQADVIQAFEDAQAAIAPVYDIEDIMSDPQFEAIGAIQTVEDEQLGAVRMQNVPFRLTGTPGQIRFTGRGLGQDNADMLDGIGISKEEMEELKDSNVI